MIAIPGLSRVEWGHEQVRLHQPRKHGGAVGAPGDGITERPVQALQRRGLKEKRPHLCGLWREHLIQ